MAAKSIFWSFIALLWLCQLVLVFALVGARHGRLKTIDRYREECISAGKKHEHKFTLLYVDGYRASSCDEAIRNIWGAE